MTHIHIQVRCSNDYALCEGRRRDEVHNLLHVSAWSAVLPLVRSVKAVTVAVIGACMAATCGGVCVPLFCSDVLRGLRDPVHPLSVIVHNLGVAVSRWSPSWNPLGCVQAERLSAKAHERGGRGPFLGQRRRQNPGPGVGAGAALLQKAATIISLS